MMAARQEDLHCADPVLLQEAALARYNDRARRAMGNTDNWPHYMRRALPGPEFGSR